MLFRSRHETGLRVTTWGLRLQHEAEPNEVPTRKLKIATTLLVKYLKGGRDQPFKSGLEETLRSKNRGHNYV